MVGATVGRFARGNRSNPSLLEPFHLRRRVCLALPLRYPSAFGATRSNPPKILHGVWTSSTKSLRVVCTSLHSFSQDCTYEGSYRCRFPSPSAGLSTNLLYFSQVLCALMRRTAPSLCWVPSMKHLQGRVAVSSFTLNEKILQSTYRVFGSGRSPPPPPGFPSPSSQLL